MSGTQGGGYSGDIWQDMLANHVRYAWDMHEAMVMMIRALDRQRPESDAKHEIRARVEERCVTTGGGAKDIWVMKQMVALGGYSRLKSWEMTIKGAVLNAKLDAKERAGPALSMQQVRDVCMAAKDGEQENGKMRREDTNIMIRIMLRRIRSLPMSDWARWVNRNRKADTRASIIQEIVDIVMGEGLVEVENDEGDTKARIKARVILMNKVRGLSVYLIGDLHIFDGVNEREENGEEWRANRRFRVYKDRWGRRARINTMKIEEWGMRQDGKLNGHMQKVGFRRLVKPVVMNGLGVMCNIGI